MSVITFGSTFLRIEMDGRIAKMTQMMSFAQTHIGQLVIISSLARRPKPPTRANVKPMPLKASSHFFFSETTLLI